MAHIGGLPSLNKSDRYLWHVLSKIKRETLYLPEDKPLLYSIEYTGPDFWTSKNPAVPSADEELSAILNLERYGAIITIGLTVSKKLDDFDPDSDELTFGPTPVITSEMVKFLKTLKHADDLRNLAKQHGSVPERDDGPYCTRLQPVFYVIPLQPKFDEMYEQLSLKMHAGDSIPNDTAIMTKTVLSLIAKCNDAATLIGSTEIFKPTTRSQKVFAELPWLQLRSEDDLAQLVDDLYFILYEGAGTDTLRFLWANGGPLDEAECRFIWCVKHLRNKWLRHDNEHGSSADVNKSHETLREELQWLGFTRLPIRTADFEHLHTRLIKEAKIFLEKLLNKLSRKDGHP